MPSFLQRLNSLKKQSVEKQNEIEKQNKTISDARAKIQQLNAELTDITEQMAVFEGRILSDTLRKKGIDLSEVTAAIEAGLFDKPPVSPTTTPTSTPTQTETEGATYSTEKYYAENNGISDKEDIDEVSDS